MTWVMLNVISGWVKKKSVYTKLEPKCMKSSDNVMQLVKGRIKINNLRQIVSYWWNHHLWNKISILLSVLLLKTKLNYRKVFTEYVIQIYGIWRTVHPHPPLFSRCHIWLEVNNAQTTVIFVVIQKRFTVEKMLKSRKLYFWGDTLRNHTFVCFIRTGIIAKSKFLSWSKSGRHMLT